MKVKCSGEVYSDPIDTDTCLECALKRGVPPCHISYPVLKAIFYNRENDKRANEVHVTDLTGCLLKAYYDKTEPAAEYVHILMNMMFGLAVHSYIEEAVKDDPHVKAEQAISDVGIVGRADAQIGSMLIDFKSTRWLDPTKRLPYGNHAEQVQIYSNATGSQSAFIQYLDMTGAQRCRECSVSYRLINGVVKCPICGYTPKRGHLGSLMIEVYLDGKEEVAAAARDRAAVLKGAMDSNVPPEAEPSWLCKYCPHTQCFHNPNF